MQELKIEIKEVDCWNVYVNDKHYRRCNDYHDLAITIGNLVKSAFRDTADYY